MNLTKQSDYAEMLNSKTNNEVSMPYKAVVRKSDDFLNWLFAHGTRVVEFLNTALLIGFTLPLIFNLDLLISQAPYPKIYLMGNPFWWAGMAILGVIQWIAMTRKGLRSNQISGYILMVSGWTWGMIASMFLVLTPSLTPTPIVYSVISFICLVAGLYLLRLNKKVEDIVNIKG